MADESRHLQTDAVPAREHLRSEICSRSQVVLSILLNATCVPSAAFPRELVELKIHNCTFSVIAVLDVFDVTEKRDKETVFAELVVLSDELSSCGSHECSPTGRKQWINRLICLQLHKNLF